MDLSKALDVVGKTAFPRRADAECRSNHGLKHERYKKRFDFYLIFNTCYKEKKSTLEGIMVRIFIVFCMFCSATNLFGVSPSEAIKRLMDGNERFRSNKMESPNQGVYRREAVSAVQKPFAIIVACADSRVAPEILFDQGIGDLFVVRVAGNVIGPFELESIEYAAKHLGSSYILVMGHQHCGAVEAVLHDKIADILFTSQLIKPSVLRARKVNSKDLLKTAIEFNAEAMSRFVQESSVVAELMAQGKMGVKAAYYNFDTGAVDLLN